MSDYEKEKDKDALHDTLEFIQKMSYQHDPLLTASFLVICGLGMYKTMLAPDDYEQMCAKIYGDRGRIKEII